MKYYTKYKGSPLNVCEVAWQITLIVFVCSGLMFFGLASVNYSSSLFEALGISVLYLTLIAFLAFIVFISLTVSFRKKLQKRAKEKKLDSIESLTAGFIIRNQTSEIEAFFDSLFNETAIQDRSERSMDDSKDYLPFNVILETFTKALLKEGIELPQNEVISIISAAFAGKYIALVSEDSDLAHRVVASFVNMQAGVSFSNFNGVYNTRLLARALEKMAAKKKLNIVLVESNENVRLQDVFAKAIPTINLRYRAAKKEVEGDVIVIPSNIVFFSIEDFDSIKTMPRTLRERAIAIEIHPTQVEPVAEMDEEDVFYDYLYRVDNLKGTYKYKEEDWKLIDSVVGVQQGFKLNNKDYVEIERYADVLTKFGYPTDKINDTILCQKILPLIVPIVSNVQDSDEMKALKKIIGSKNENLNRVLMNYVYEEIEDVEEDNG